MMVRRSFYHQFILQSADILIPFLPFALQCAVTCIGNGDGTLKFLLEDPIVVSKCLHFRRRFRRGRGGIRLRLAFRRR